MAFDKEAAQKHVEQEHECPACGTKVHGNGFYTHKKACKIKNADKWNEIWDKIDLELEQLINGSRKD